MQWGVGEPRAPPLCKVQRLTPLPAKILYPAWTRPWTIISCPGPLPVNLGGPPQSTAWIIVSPGFKGRSFTPPPDSSDP